jgi:carboxyl-terminal processing protease
MKRCLMPLLMLLIVCGPFPADWPGSPVLLQARQAPAETEAEAAGETDFDPAVHLESFDQVWETIRKTHWDPSKVGESWQTAREKFRPQVESATSVREVRVAMTGLLESLDQSHFGIVPREEYEEMNEEKGEGGEGTAGLEIRLVGDDLLVTRVWEGFPAAMAGVRPGWIVKLIGKRTADEILEGAGKVNKHSVARLETAVGLICDARISGDVGEKIPFAFIDENDDVRLEYLSLAAAPGQQETFGNLPPFHVTFEARELPDDIGYIAFNSFLGGPHMAQAWAEAIKGWQEQGKRGLIIDLRGNRGGLMLLVSAMCGWLVDERQSIGTTTMAGGNHLNIVLNPRKPRFQGPVAVLTDACSISAAEVMAGGIKDLEIGRIFGGTTAGLVLPSTVVRLPNGDGFQYALSSWESASGVSIEGTGVVPHEPLELSRELLLKSADPVLSAAKKWILEQGTR